MAEYVQVNLTSQSPYLGITFWQADFGDPINYLERFHSENTRGNYQIDEIDQLIDRSREQSNDPSARWQTLIAIEKMALDTYTLHAPIYQTFQPILEKPTVEDINRPGQSFTNYRWAKISE